MKFLPNYRKGASRGGCCVPNCSSKRNLDTNLSFHRIPEHGALKIERRNLFNNVEMVDKHDEWMRILKIKCDSKNLFVCSLHFDEKDYCFPDIPAKSRVLKRNAVPKAIKLNTQEINEIKPRRKKRQKKRNLKKKIINKIPDKKVKKVTTIENGVKNVDEIGDSSFITNKKDFHEDSSNCENEEVESHDIDCEDNYREKSNDDLSMENIVREEQSSNADFNTNQNNGQHAIGDEGVKVTTGNFSVLFCSFIESEKNLITMCNIKSFAILNQLVRLMDTHYPKRKFEMTTRDCILLATVKLKLDIPFAALAVFFKEISVVKVENIFYDTIQGLARIFEATISRASTEEIQSNVAKCSDKSTKTVIEYTEIQIEQANCLKCKIKYSSYDKGHPTIKFITEVSPGGIILSVSEAFCNCVSESSIFNHIGTLNSLQSTRDDSMIDKDSLIDKECFLKEIRLIRPHSLRSKDHLIRDEASAGSDISSVRVQMDRKNQRIKEYKILSNTYPAHMMEYIDDVFLLCCGLTNLATLF